MGSPVAAPPAETIAFTLNGDPVESPPIGSLLDVLRERFGVRSAKDGCSPQGQCGCCTVWVDGQPRVACVTPVSRVRGRSVTTVEGLPDADLWAQRFCDNGGSQCGFCTPGIIMRAAALDDAKRGSPELVKRALLGHLCRCTGWGPIVDAITGTSEARPVGSDPERRAALEGGVPQSVGNAVALGTGGFADDTAPPSALVALLDGSGDWVVADTLVEARQLSGKVQGRRTTAPVSWPVEVPPGQWARTLQTTWVEPAYLEPDASWCEPGGEPRSSYGNGGAFGGKSSGELGAVARRLADQHQRPVRALYTREDVVRLGPKRPPLAVAVTADGGGVARVARTEGIVTAIETVAPGLDVVEVDVTGPATSARLRAAGWAEVAVVLASLQPGPWYRVTAPSGATAEACYTRDRGIEVTLRCGDALDETVLASYCTGAAHMALGWVTSEAISVDEQGRPLDLTIRSFGIVRAVDMPPVSIEIISDDGPPVNGSDAVFAAVATAVWASTDWAPRWPIGR